MSSTEIQFKCQCAEEYKVRFRKPGLVRPVTVTTECPSCGSEYLLKFRQHPEKERRSALHMVIMKTTLSQELVELLAEERQWQEANK